MKDKVKFIKEFDSKPFMELIAQCEDSRWVSGGNSIDKEMLFLRDNSISQEMKKLIEDNLKDLHENYSYQYHIHKLGGGKELYPHIDNASNLDKLHLYHFVLKTNKKAIFISDGEKFHFEKNKLYEVNNYDYLHSVENNGKSDRIHILIELLSD